MTESALPRVRADLLAVLGGPDGSRIAATALRRRRLPAGDDWVADVVQTATVQVLRRFRDGADEPDRPVVAAAYATTVIKHIVHKLVEGRRYDAPMNDRDQPSLPAAGLDHLFASEDFVDLVRAGIEAQANPPYSGAAAALAYVTLVAHPESMASFPDAPMPQRGADEHQAIWWPALWLAGLGQLTESGASSSQSRRRQRAVQQAQVLCERSLVAAMLESSRHG